MTHVERRRRRSQKVLEALSFQLTALQEQEDLLAFVLADRDGLLVAAAPSSLDVEVLSALCPMVSRGEASPEEISSVVAHPNAFPALLSLKTSSEELYLFSVGKSPERANRAAQSAEGGIYRILKMFEEPSAAASY